MAWVTFSLVHLKNSFVPIVNLLQLPIKNLKTCLYKSLGRFTQEIHYIIQVRLNVVNIRLLHYPISQQAK